MTGLDACMRQLEALLETENVALAEMRIETVTALAAEKRHLVDRLRDFRTTDGPGVHKASSTQLNRLSRLCDHNKILLERAIQAHRRLMGLIIAATQPPVTGYGRRGDAAATRNPQARAIAARA